MGDTIDLGAARRARHEAQGDPPRVLFDVSEDGDDPHEFVLPLELPFSITQAMAADDALGILKGLFGDQLDAFLALGPSLDDIKEFANGAVRAYGLEPGEAAASNGSSPSGGKRSRQTSSGSTA